MMGKSVKLYAMEKRPYMYTSAVVVEVSTMPFEDPDLLVRRFSPVMLQIIMSLNYKVISNPNFNISNLGLCMYRLVSSHKGLAHET